MLNALPIIHYQKATQPDETIRLEVRVEYKTVWLKNQLYLLIIILARTR